MAGEGIELQELLHQHGKAVDTLTHVGRAHRQVDAHAGRHRDHGRASSSAATRRANRAGSIPSSARTRRPFVKAISTTPGRRCGQATERVATGGVVGTPAIRTGENSGFCGPLSEMPGMSPFRACLIQAWSWLRLMPLRSATADTVAPGSSASVRTLTFCSAVQRLRRSTREMISPTLSIGVLTHVFKDANAHDLRQHNKGSSGLTLTIQIRLDELLHNHLSDAIGYSGHTQNPFTSRLLGYGDGTHRRRKVASRAHPIPELVEIALQVGFELLNGHLIHTGRTLIGFDRFVSLVHLLLGDIERLVCRTHRHHPVSSCFDHTTA